MRYHWVKYNSLVLVRVMKGTTFAHKEIILGKNVQLGQYCHIDTDITLGNNVLVAVRACFIDKYGHQFNKVGQTIWDSESKEDDTTII